jgi:hypothetical protein
MINSYKPLDANLPNKIDCRRSDLETAVLPLLRGQIFHVTEEAMFENITRAGYIPSSLQTQFTSAFGRSENNYGRQRGWVSLLDLRDATDAYIKEALTRYYLLKVFHDKTASIYVLFIAERAWSSLIPWRHARDEVGRKQMCIPFVEAWYPGDLPLSLVSDTLVVKLRSYP